MDTSFHNRLNERNIMTDSIHQHMHYFGTKRFKQKYGAGSSTQALWRQKGMPYYRVPNSKTILYKAAEIDSWLAEGKVESDND